MIREGAADSFNTEGKVRPNHRLRTTQPPRAHTCSSGQTGYKIILVHESLHRECWYDTERTTILPADALLSCKPFLLDPRTHINSYPAPSFCNARHDNQQNAFTSYNSGTSTFSAPRIL